MSALLMSALLLMPLLLSSPAWAAETSSSPPDVSGASSTHERLETLVSELAAIVAKYGSDAVALQASLLVESLRAGALAPTEVTVVGPSNEAGPQYLRFEVVTGLIFDSAVSTERSCADTIWSKIAAPVLAKMESFSTEPAGLEFVFSYGLQDFSLNSGRQAVADEPYELASLSIAIPAEVLAELAADEIAIDDVLARSRRVYSRPSS